MRIIAGAYKGRELRTVTGPGYRPAMGKVREALFSMLEARGVIWGAARVLDVFAGSGSLGFEALSRGAPEALFMEKDAAAAACLRKNAERLGCADRCRVLAGDAVRGLVRRPEAPFDVVFVDPPYGQDLFVPALKNLLRQGWLAENGWLIAEVEPGLALRPNATAGLTEITERLYGQTRILIWTRDV